MIHHLTDAGWSVAIRRFCEHLGALLFPWLAILFVPVALLAPKIYHLDDAQSARRPRLERQMAAVHLAGFYRRLGRFCSASGGCCRRGCVIGRSSRMKPATPLCTYRMRFHSGWGILAFAATVTLASGVSG